MASVSAVFNSHLPLSMPHCMHYFQAMRVWLAILSTKIDLAEEEIVRIYGKRWDIEVFFKMMKHYLNLEWETQLWDFDGIIGHITIGMIRYVFLSFEQRCHDDPRTLGSLFYAYSEEQQDLSLGEAMRLLLSLALGKVRAAGVIVEDVVLAIVDTVSRALPLVCCKQGRGWHALQT